MSSNPDPPFFIIGNPRSGTSLLRLMLNSHPNITVPPECGFAMWLWPKYRDKFPIDSNIVTQFCIDVLQSRKFETWGLKENELRDYMDSKRFRHYADLSRSIYAAYAHHYGKNPTVVGDKNNYYIDGLNDLRLAFPESKIIFMVRDGRDVACSYFDLNRKNVSSKYRPKLPDKISDIAETWRSSCERIDLYIGRKTYLIRYEDLVINAEFVLSGISKFLGVSYHPRMLDYYKNNDEPAEFMQWKKKTLQPPDQQNIGKFRTDLTLELVAEFETIAGDMLERYGYTLSSR